MAEAYTAAELGKLALPGLPTGERGIQIMADREGWPRQKRLLTTPGRKPWEYPISALPKEARDALMRQQLAAQPEPSLPAAQPAKGRAVVVKAAAFGSLKTWQTQALDARAAILAEIDRLVLVTGETRGRAIDVVVESAQSGTLPPFLAALVPLANARSGKAGTRTLSRRTVYRWFVDREQGVTALAPKEKAEAGVPAWGLPLLKQYGRPQKPSLQECIKRMHLPDGVERPSYDQAKRFLKRVNAVERNRGRMGPRELKSLRAYTIRDTSDMWPTDVYSADGHTFDAEVRHPKHGRPFRPEITTVIDIATRLIVGWSVGLAENSQGVIEAMIQAVRKWGIASIFYVDNGAGFNNALLSAEVLGLLARLGTTKINSAPYNSQARGIIERVHQTVWVSGAKQLPTYMGAPMDREARQKVHKLTRSDLKQYGASAALMEWREFMAWAQAQVDAYNARPHSSLLKVADPETGKRRHQTPLEAWEAARAEGFEPFIVSDAEAVDLARPYEQKTVQRCMVQALGQKYFSDELEGWHGEEVLVGYDIHDGSKVYVRAMDGRLICEAQFEANKQRYFPRSLQDKADETRFKGRLARAEIKVDEIHAERPGSRVIDVTPEPLSPAAELIHQKLILDMTIDAVPMVALPAPQPVQSSTPAQIETPAARFERWCELDARIQSNNEEVPDKDRTWWQRYQLTAEWKGEKSFRASFDLPARKAG